MLSRLAPVSRETLARLQRYGDLLVEWQDRINLVASSTLAHLWRRHMADSLQCVGILPDKAKWLDLGTGAGFPGLVIAIALTGRPGARVDLIETNGKKCAFLRQVIRETGAPAFVHCQRIERSGDIAAGVEVVVGRALAPLPRLLAHAAPWLEKGATGLFHKGRDHRAEIEECHGVWRFDLIEHGSQIEPGSVLLEIRDLRPSKVAERS